MPMTPGDRRIALGVGAERLRVGVGGEPLMAASGERPRIERRGVAAERFREGCREEVLALRFRKTRSGYYADYDDRGRAAR